jgi:tetraacyldisaccharide 4'-kinase
MIDALDPFGGGALLPLGRLREPLDALAHADIFVIMRAERGRSYEAIERVLRRYNRDAPVFHARVTPGAWIDAATGDTAAIAGPVAAFCGLGNPDAFRRTLQTAGVNLVSFRSFSDHHRYSRRDLERLWEEARAAGASALVTTEKDVMNFPDRSLTVAAPIYWLQTTIEVDREAELLAAGCYAENSGYE